MDSLSLASWVVAGLAALVLLLCALLAAIILYALCRQVSA
jgi:hypothetical protein